MFNKRLFFVTLIFLCVISCGIPEKNVLKIGAILPLTGDIASYGKNAQNGIDLAAEEINGFGGINGKRVEVVYGNDKGLSTEAINIFNKMINIDKIPVVIGSAASSVTLALCPIAKNNKVVILSPISSSRELTYNGGEYFFRVCPSDAFQSHILAEWIWSKEFKTVGIIFVNNSWGIGLKDEFVNSYVDIGGKIIIMEASIEGQKDFRTQITKLLDQKPEAIVGLTYGKEGGILIKQIKELGGRLPIFGGDVWSSSELLESAGDAAEGVFFTVPSKLTGEKYQQFAKKYAKRYGKEPEVYASYSYDAMNIISNALKESCFTGEQIKNYFRTMLPYDGVTGITKFDEHGDVLSKSFSKQQLENGKHKEIE